MPRIIAGSARGRRLVAPSGRGTRPTSDRMREGLFSSLTAMYGSLAGARFLDVFAGSGAVGLEAMSRGAEHALLVEHERRAAATAEANASTLAFRGAVVRTTTAERLAADPPGEPPYDIAFLDPPYDLPAEQLAGILRSLHEHGWLAPGSIAVVERATRDRVFDWPDGFEADRSRAYGEGTLWYAHVVPIGPASNGNDD